MDVEVSRDHDTFGLFVFVEFAEHLQPAAGCSGGDRIDDRSS
jgi:hypothetical protein